MTVEQEISTMAPPPIVSTPDVTHPNLSFPADSAQISRVPGKGIQEAPAPLEKATNAIKISAVMSHPRLGFMDNFFTVFKALLPLRINIHSGGGAFWGQCMERVMLEAIEKEKPDVILTLDYDTLFRAEDVGRLAQLMANNPSVDAIAAIQSHRYEALPLMTILDAEQKPIKQIGIDYFMSDLSRVSTAHFGLTMIRVKSLLATPHPWFLGVPNKDGMWAENRLDEDIYFWKHWQEHGHNLYLANRVVIGHGEWMIRWPGRDFRVIYQHSKDYFKDGPPVEAWQ